MLLVSLLLSGTILFTAVGLFRGAKSTHIRKDERVIKAAVFSSIALWPLSPQVKDRVVWLASSGVTGHVTSQSFDLAGIKSPR